LRKHRRGEAEETWIEAPDHRSGAFVLPARDRCARRVDNE